MAGITEVYNRQIERLSSLPDTPAGQAERSRLIALAAVISKYGLVEAPTLEDPTFVPQGRLQRGRGRAGPKPKLNYIFPSPDAAQIVIRCERPDRGGADPGDRLIAEAASDPSTSPLAARGLRLAGGLQRPQRRAAGRGVDPGPPWRCS